MRFCAGGLNIETSAVCIAVLWFGVDGILLSYWFLTCTFIFYWASVPGLTNNNAPPSESPVRWLSLSNSSMKQAFFILFFLVNVFVSKAQNVNQALSVTDTTDLTVRLDSNVIVINKNILGKQFLVNLFIDDYTFINYFQNNRDKPMYVYINEIEVLDSVTFRFNILSRHVISKTYQTTGFCNYIIKCGTNPISKKTSIMRIEFHGCEI